jgi:AsnC-type helix-turn-helix domain
VTAELDALPSLLGAELDGVLTHRLTPVLQYFRTVAEWRAGVLTPAEVAALELPGVPPEQTRAGLRVDDVDRAIIDALVADGRTPYEAIASLAGFSQATARRRIDQLIQRGLCASAPSSIRHKSACPSRRSCGSVVDPSTRHTSEARSPVRLSCDTPPW